MLIFGKVWEARSRLYRSRFLEENYSFGNSWRDLEDLHTFAPLRIKNSAKFRQSLSHNYVCNFIFQNFTYFLLYLFIHLVQIPNFHFFPEFQLSLRKILTPPRFSSFHKFPGTSQITFFLNFQKIVFEKLLIDKHSQN